MNAYACYNNNEKIRLMSSSGGIYYLLAEAVIKCSGVVFAACYNENLDVEHCMIETEEALQKSCGSKYVQSCLGTTFKQIRELIDEKRKVMFVGTPCQCAGLLSFLKGHPDELLCVDCICHGVPGVKEWHRYRDSLEKRGFILSEVNMRDKTTGWTGGNYCWRLTDKSGRSIVEKLKDNLYMQGFIHNVFLNKGCYTCKYKGVERATDITLGDFWGIEYLDKSMDDGKGVSLVLIHTKLGYDWFENISNKITYKCFSVEQAIMKNPSIEKAPSIPKTRDKYYKKMEQGKDFIDTLTSFDRVWRAKAVLKLAKRKFQRFLTGRY